jgi:quercetin dioxygenase-like cupin family protein
MSTKYWRCIRPSLKGGKVDKRARKIMRVFRLEEGETFRTLGGLIRWVVWPKTGARNVTLHYAVLEPGQKFASHKHDYSEDVITVIQGKGRIRTDKEDSEIEAGMVVYVDAKEPHEVTNTGDEAMVMIGSQGPPDLELYRRAGKL